MSHICPRGNLKGFINFHGLHNIYFVLQLTTEHGLHRWLFLVSRLFLSDIQNVFSERADYNIRLILDYLFRKITALCTWASQNSSSTLKTFSWPHKSLATPDIKNILFSVLWHSPSNPSSWPCLDAFRGLSWQKAPHSCCLLCRTSHPYTHRSRRHYS